MKVCALCHVAVVLGRIPFDRLEQVAEELLCEILERFEYALLREPDLAEKNIRWANTTSGLAQRPRGRGEAAAIG